MPVQFDVKRGSQYGDNKKVYYFNVYFSGEEAKNRIEKAKVSKGSAIRVIGAFSPTEQNFTRQDGIQDHKTVLNINGMDWEYLPSVAKKENTNAAGTSTTASAYAAPASAPKNAVPAQRTTAPNTARQPEFASSPDDGNFVDLGEDDDLPF